MKLNDLFSDGVILQREKPIKIFGTGKGNISVTFRNRTQTLHSEKETFCLTFPAEKAGGPYNMKVVIDGETQIVENVYVGDVYFVSGQSNMQYSFGSQTQPPIHISRYVRVFTVKSSFEEYQHEKDNTWLDFREDNYPRISNIGIRFAALISEYAKVPVGIVCCAVGASVIESWLPADALERSGLLLPLSLRHNDATERWYNRTGTNFEKMFSVVSNFAYKAVLWYQGESNCKKTEAKNYGRLFKKLVEIWREAFGERLPFFTVQLPPYEETVKEHDWAELRAQQFACSQELDGVYMVTSGDNVETDNIHPHNKDTVAYRLFLAVKNELFGDREEYRGPVIKEVRFYKDKLQISFAFTAGELLQTGEIVLNVSREDRHFSVIAQTNGDCLLVKGIEIGDVVGMAQGNADKVRLTGKTGLPAVPFCITVK